MNLNKVFICGRLTKDPVLRATPAGQSVASFSLATNKMWTGKDGQKQEQTEFHNIVVFGRQAETCAQYLKKGSSAYVEGRLQTRTWEGEKGKQYKTEIIAERVQFGPRPGGSGPRTVEEAPQKAPKEETIEYPEEDINPDDIPF